MVCTYEEYLKRPKAITFAKMQTIHTEMIAEIGTDVDALELYDELIKIATRYATIRANWLLLSREEKNEQDSGRTSCHNSVIIHFNMLARYLKQQGRTAAWRDELGYRRFCLLFSLRECNKCKIIFRPSSLTRRSFCLHDYKTQYSIFC